VKAFRVVGRGHDRERPIVWRAVAMAVVMGAVSGCGSAGTEAPSGERYLEELPIIAGWSATAFPVSRRGRGSAVPRSPQARASRRVVETR